MASFPSRYRFELLLFLTFFLSSHTVATFAGADPVDSSPQGSEITEPVDGGTAHYFVDGQGRKTGLYRELFASGKTHVKGAYLAGARTGMWITYGEDGKTLETCTYFRGEIKGFYSWNAPDSKSGFDAVRRDGGYFGVLKIRDATGNVIHQGKYPRSLLEISKMWATLHTSEPGDVHFASDPVIKAPYAPGALADDTLQQALKLVKLYRYLAGVPYASLTIDPAANIKAQHGAVLLQKLQGLTHTPSKPADMDDAFFALGYAGCHEGNIYQGYIGEGNGLLNSIRAYMDDSDATNVRRVGHRCWVLFPALSRVGFGYANAYATMHVIDPARPIASHPAAVVTFPSEGYYPVPLIERHYAWSAAFPLARYQASSVTMQVTALDDHFQKVADVPVDMIASPSDEFQGWTVVIFRPKFNPDSQTQRDDPMSPGRYWVEAQGLKGPRGAPCPFGYLVDLIDPTTVATTNPSVSAAVQ